MRVIGVRVATPLFVVTPHTLVLPAKSTRRCAVLWLIRRPTDHLRTHGEACVYRNSDSAILMMKAAEDRSRCNGAKLLNDARERRVLGQ